MIVPVKYLARVYVYVEVDEGYVVDVVVHDEDPELIDGQDPDAVRIAEKSTEWPAWTFGW